MKVRLDVDTNTFVRFWLVVIAFGLVGLMIYSAREALIIIGAAMFLALALNGPVARLARVLPGKSRLGGTALAFTLVILILSAVVWFVIPPLVQQSAKFASTIPSIAENVSTQWHGLRNFIEANNLQPQVDATLENIKEQSAKWATDAGSNIIGSVGSVASSLVSLFLIIVLSFLMLLEGPMWMERIWSIYKDKQKMREHRRIASRVASVITGYITGQLTVSAIGALAAGSFVFILSFIFPIPANLSMPTILLTFILSLIPMFGATLAGVLVGVLLLFNNATAAIIYGIFFIVYQQIENNFISPAIQAKKVELSALVVLVAVTIGIYVGGMLGGVIAIPIAGTVKVFIEEYLRRRQRSETHESQEVIARVEKGKLKKQLDQSEKA